MIESLQVESDPTENASQIDSEGNFYVGQIMNGKNTEKAHHSWGGVKSKLVRLRMEFSKKELICSKMVRSTEENGRRLEGMDLRSNGMGRVDFMRITPG